MTSGRPSNGRPPQLKVYPEKSAELGRALLAMAAASPSSAVGGSDSERGKAEGAAGLALMPAAGKAAADSEETASSLPLIPRWPLYGVETGTMLGNPGSIVLSEMVLKGVLSEKGEQEAVLQAALATAVKGPPNSIPAHEGLPLPFPPEEEGGVRRKKGTRSRTLFISDATPRSVSRGIELAASDSCVARLAAKLGRQKEADQFQGRAGLFRSYWDPETKLMRPRTKEGGWGGDVDPTRPKSPADRAYTEGTPLQYTMAAAWHDTPGLAELFGGNAGLEEALDEYFSEKVGGSNSSAFEPGNLDLMGGHLGGHAQSNEHDQHVPYLYDYLPGAFGKTRKAVSRLQALYAARPDGLQ